MIKIHSKFKLNDVSYSKERLRRYAMRLIEENRSEETTATGNFLLEWTNDNASIFVKTSGSTGSPKTIELSKQAMVASAVATGTFFRLHAGDTSLNCLSTQYIAGKMMLVRAMVLGLELDSVKPEASPKFNNSKPYDFCAMVPMQLEKSYREMRYIKTLIVGGAPLLSPLVAELKEITTTVYETYGMTETITHIAAKKINHLDKKESPHTFKVLPGINIYQDQRGCLEICAERLSQNKIITNDVVKLYTPFEFEWLGRYDNVINSGGIKLFPEQIEKKIAPFLSERFFIASIPDNLLGEKAVLYVEGKTVPNEQIFKALERYEIPKHIVLVERFEETESGKVKRFATKPFME